LGPQTPQALKAWGSTIPPNVSGGIMEKKKKKLRQMYFFGHLLFVEIYVYSGKERKKPYWK